MHLIFYKENDPCAKNYIIQKIVERKQQRAATFETCFCFNTQFKSLTNVSLISIIKIIY